MWWRLARQVAKTLELRGRRHSGAARGREVSVCEVGAASVLEEAGVSLSSGWGGWLQPRGRSCRRDLWGARTTQQ